MHTLFSQLPPNEFVGLYGLHRGGLTYDWRADNRLPIKYDTVRGGEFKTMNGHTKVYSRKFHMGNFIFNQRRNSSPNEFGDGEGFLPQKI